MFRCVVLMVWLVVATAANAEPRALPGTEIKQLVTGTVMHINTPLNTVIPVHYGQDGSLKAHAGAMGFYLGATEDTGRWWVSRTRLCHKWTRWFDGDAQCLKLRKQGNKVFWESQKGEAGTAVIKRTMPSEINMQVAAAPKATVMSTSMPRADRRPTADKKVVGTVKSATSKTKFQMASLGARPSVKTDKQKRMAQKKKLVSKKANISSRKKAKSKRTVKAPARKKKIVKATKATKATKASSALRQTSWQMNPSFRVAHVSELDVLNIRKRPSEYSPIVGAIPHRARGVKIVGVCQAWWCPVSHGRVTGWANRFYLAAER